MWALFANNRLWTRGGGGGGGGSRCRKGSIKTDCSGSETRSSPATWSFIMSDAAAMVGAVGHCGDVKCADVDCTGNCSPMHGRMQTRWAAVTMKFCEFFAWTTNASVCKTCETALCSASPELFQDGCTVSMGHCILILFFLLATDLPDKLIQLQPILVVRCSWYASVIAFQPYSIWDHGAHSAII